VKPAEDGTRQPVKKGRADGEDLVATVCLKSVAGLEFLATEGDEEEKPEESCGNG
jgi:hypothetical protein